MKRPPNSNSGIRIIGGEWRGRRLPVPNVTGLRPTLDRFRETLFNWLMFDVEGARCLDLFAGSGALGLEALSRGATYVDFVDSSKAAITGINQHLASLNCAAARTHQQPAEAWLKAQSASDNFAPYDLIFLDPPYHQDLLQPCLHWLAHRGFTASGSKIYLEAEQDFNPQQLPKEWQIAKKKASNNKQLLLATVKPQEL